MKKLITLTLSMLLRSFTCVAQPELSNTPEETTSSEQTPDPGFSLGSYLANNINYPEYAREEGIQGTVILKFVVTKSGGIDSIRVVKSLHDSLDKEAIRVVKSMPRWKPGRSNGRPVNKQYLLPIRFNVDADKPDYIPRKKDVSGPIYSYAEQMPQPDLDIPQYIASRVESFSNKEFAGINGKVVLRFIVTTEGNTDSIRVIKSIHPAIDSMAINFIGEMPLWIPGIQNGKSVNVYYTLPIAFKFATDTVNVPTDSLPDITVSISDTNMSLLSEPVKSGRFEKPTPNFDYRKYYNEQLRYPAYLDKNGMQGTVVVRYAVDQWGYAGEVTVISSPHSMFSEEVTRWVLAMPRWNPAKMDGKPVKFQIRQTINFIQTGSNFHSKKVLFRN